MTTRAFSRNMTQRVQNDRVFIISRGWRLWSETDGKIILAGEENTSSLKQKNRDNQLSVEATQREASTRCIVDSSRRLVDS